MKMNVDIKISGLIPMGLYYTIKKNTVIHHGPQTP